MSPALASYPRCKYSGTPLLREVPVHWEVRRLRTVAQLLVSNIDKNAVEGELPVRLCNYVDVYKHERITAAIQFMHATATVNELARWQLHVDDVLITKDSESWTDIGVPSLVEYSAPDLVCGYHLAILRPRTELVRGEYLLRVLQTEGVATQFHVLATGVTRYGLSHNAIKSVLVPIPPLPEQAAIVRFLDHADRRIQRYIRAKKKLIALLNEQKQAIIHQAVTRGLDPNVRLKPSGVEWLGDVPEHWEVVRAKHLFREVDERSSSGAEELLSVSHITGVTPRSHKTIPMFMAPSYVGSKLCRPADLVINTMWAWMGALGSASQPGIVSPSYAVYRPLAGSQLLAEYTDLLLRTGPYIAEYTRRSTGIRSSRLRLYPDQFLNMSLVLPPLDDQLAILRYVTNETTSVDSVIRSTRREIDLLHEYRTRLISDVVTSKLDVREAAAKLPDEADDMESLDDIGETLEEIDDINLDAPLEEVAS